MIPTARRNVLLDLRADREDLRRARYRYHLSLVVAHEAGHTDAEIAEVLDTDPLYVANAIRRHKERECGCRA